MRRREYEATGNAYELGAEVVILLISSLNWLCLFIVVKHEGYSPITTVVCI